MNYYLSEDGKMYSNLDADEWEILQTLPKGYTACVKDAERHKCIGNGWTVDVIAHIFTYLKGGEGK
jgi:DNA (cytosine-5)-methyltransferase 3A